MHPLYGHRNRIDRARTAAMSAAASGTKGDQSAAIGNLTAERCAAANSTPCLSVPFRAADVGDAVLADGRPRRHRGQKMTWYEALFRSLNPKNIDWGMSWEHRRSIFLENSIGNKYFMYTAALSLLLVYSFVVIVWQRWNHAERLKQLAQRAADAMNYAKYWKQGADKATRKHNAHIEKCNRVIEAGENGLPGGDTAEAGELRRQIEGMRIEALNLTSENKRLRHDLEQKSTIVADLSVRVDDAAKKVGNGNGPGNGAKGGENSVQVATLVDRINRLEETLRTVRQENERLKGA